MHKETKKALGLFLLIYVMTVSIISGIIVSGPSHPSQTIHGTVIDRGRTQGGTWWIQVLFDDPINGVVNFTVPQDTYRACGFGANFNLYYNEYYSGILNMTATS